MKILDELAADKVLDFLYYVLSKFIKPDMTLNEVNELDIPALEASMLEKTLQKMKLKLNLRMVH